MTDGNESAFPEVQEQPQFNHHSYGLTKREYFACNLTVNMDKYGCEMLEQLMDSEIPTTKLENLKWWMKAEARIKVLKADALIEELNKQNTTFNTKEK